MKQREHELAATDTKMRAEQDAAVQQGNQSHNVIVLYQSRLPNTTMIMSNTYQRGSRSGTSMRSKRSSCGVSPRLHSIKCHACVQRTAFS